MHGVFQLVRLKDVSGVAGTGVVATGYVAPNGRACMIWCVPGMPMTTVAADSFEDLCIHLHGGKTIVKWIWVENNPGKCIEEDFDFREEQTNL